MRSSHVAPWIWLVILAGATRAIPLIEPNESEITLTESNDRVLECRSETDAQWFFADASEECTYFPNGDDQQRLPLNVTNVRDPVFDERVSYLTVTRSARHVGYYYCVETPEAGHTPTGAELAAMFESKRAARIYVYLDLKNDDLAAIVENTCYLTGYIGQSLNIPCIPTNKDVTVTLSKNGLHLQDIPFDPRQGFRMQIDSIQQTSDYACEYMRNGHDEIVEREISVDIEEPNPQRTQDRPSITSLHGKFISKSENIELVCTKRDEGNIITWELPGGRLEENPRARVDLTTKFESKLTVRELDQEIDSGSYKCTISTKTNPPQIESTAFTVHVKESTDCQIDIDEAVNGYATTVRHNAAVRWIVDFYGHPKPLHAEWTGPNGQFLSSDDKFNVTTKPRNHGRYSTILYFSNADINDMGAYTLRITSAASESCTEARIFNLFVEEPPTISLPPAVHVIRNSELVVRCTVIGYPASDISWSWTACPLRPPRLEPWSINEPSCRNGRMSVALTDNIALATHSPSAQNSTLRFRPTEPGRLTCVAQNNQSAVSESTAVYVLSGHRDVAVQQEPRVWIEGGEASIVCAVQAFNFTSDIWWQRDGEGRVREEPNYVAIGRDFVHSTHRVWLNFSSVRPADAGIYRCVAHTFAAEAHEVTHVVSVHAQRAPSVEGERVHRAPAQLLRRGDALRLFCSPEGMPVPVVRWLRNDELMEMENETATPFRFASEPVDGNELRFVHSLSLERVEYEDEAEYRCMATNDNGVGEQVTQVQVPRDGPSGLVIGLVSGLLALLLVTVAVGWFFYRREHRKWLELKRAGIAYFDNGNMRDYNPELGRMEQADLLPYDMAYEFPRERLRLSGMKLGHGAFGVVYKAVAVGIQPDVAETVVAVKTIKHGDREEDVKALISELKIMIHMGKHVNVVNLLGAVTRDLKVKRSLYVIIEYCDLGNLYNFLKKNREHFVNQVDHVRDEINSEILTIQQQVHEYGLKYINLRHVSNNNHDYSLRPHYENTASEPDAAPTSMSATFPHSIGLDSGAGLLSNDTARASRRTTSSFGLNGIGRHSQSGYVHSDFHTVTTTDLVCWSFQVANGMAYLASRGVLHGDLAARNILLCSDKVVKICDFGLSRSLNPDEDYQKESDGKLPIKWLAMESISHKIFNTQTDVWSFGVFMWELFSMAQVPYAEDPPDKLLIRLQAGHRLLRPRFATQRVYDVMRECWLPDPARRPRFETLVQRMGDMLPLEVRQEFVDLNDQYLQVNIDEGRGDGDYLSGLLPPEAQAPGVPQMAAPAPPRTLATIELGDQSPEEIPMLPRGPPQSNGGAGRRAGSPLARSDTDTDLDREQWRRSVTIEEEEAGAEEDEEMEKPIVSPRRFPPQNTYVNLPTVSAQVNSNGGGGGSGGSGGSDAISNPGYAYLNQR